MKKKEIICFVSDANLTYRETRYKRLRMTHQIFMTIEIEKEAKREQIDTIIVTLFQAMCANRE